jgi:hypothetical protein
MSVLYGVIDTKRNFVDLPAGWDEEFLASQKTRGGFSYLEVFDRLNQKLLAINLGLVGAHRFIPSLSYPSSDGTTKYVVGGGGGIMEDRTEYSEPKGIQTRSTGHMIPNYAKIMALAWTDRYLRKHMTEFELETDLTEMENTIISTFEVICLNALFRIGDVTIGGSGKSPGLSDGGLPGASSLAYTPPAFEGEVFTSTHPHYGRYTQAQVGIGLEWAVANLDEHGFYADYIGITDKVNRAFWKSIDADGVKFLDYNEVGVIYPDDAAIRLAVSREGGQRFLGALKTSAGLIWLMDSSRIRYNPTGGDSADAYISIFKTEGDLNPMNVLAWRFDEMDGIGAYASAHDLGGATTNKITIASDFGFAVSNRIKAVNLRIGVSGNYVNPIIR